MKMNQLKNNQDIKNLFEQEEDYFKPVRGGGGVLLLVKIISNMNEYLDQIEPYYKDNISNLRKSDASKIQLTIAAINCISFKDTNDESVMHSKNSSIETMIYAKACEVIKKNLINSL